MPLAVFSANGEPIAIESTVAVDACAAVVVGHTVELAIGTAELRFGPTTTTTVRAVIEHAGPHEHE